MRPSSGPFQRRLRSWSKFVPAGATAAEVFGPILKSYRKISRDALARGRGIMLSA